MKFRRAHLEDLPFIVEVYNATIPSRIATADISVVSVSEKTPWFLEHDDTHPIWIIEEHDEAVGWASLSKFHERPAYAGTAEVGIYLQTNNQGKGIGKSALSLLMEESTKLGFKTLLALIFAHNLPSIRLFTHAGFSVWGHLPEVAIMDGQRYDLEIMGKHIHLPE